MPHGPAEVGVGPWRGTVARRGRSTTPSCSREGDRRNVVDRYRYWTLDGDRRRPRHPPPRLPRRHRELAARLQHRHRSCAPPTRSSPPRCTSSATGAGTAAARWSPTATSTCATTRRAADLAAYLHEPGPVRAARHRQPARAPRTSRRWRCRAGSASCSARRARASPEAARAGLRRDVLDRAVRLDPVDQRLRGRRDRDAHLGPRRTPTCPATTPGAAERVRSGVCAGRHGCAAAGPSPARGMRLSTVPSLTPSSCAVSVTDSPSQCRQHHGPALHGVAAPASASTSGGALRRPAGLACCPVRAVQPGRTAPPRGGRARRCRRGTMIRPDVRPPRRAVGAAAAARRRTASTSAVCTRSSAGASRRRSRRRRRRSAVWRHLDDRVDAAASERRRQFRASSTAWSAGFERGPGR